MDCQTVDLVTDELNLACVDRRPDAQSQVGHRLATRQGASNRPGSTIEDGQHAIPGEFGHSTPELVNNIRQSLIVTGKKSGPSLIAEPMSGTCRVDDVGKNQRHQHPFLEGVKGHEPGACSHPRHGDKNLIADHPRIVARWQINDVALGNVELGTVLGKDMHLALQHQPDVS
jgi:hypothetical protein